MRLFFCKGATEGMKQRCAKKTNDRGIPTSLADRGTAAVVRSSRSVQRGFSACFACCTMSVIGLVFFCVCHCTRKRAYSHDFL